MDHARHRSSQESIVAMTATVCADDWYEREGPPRPGVNGRLAAGLGGIAISAIILLALHYAQHIEAVRPVVETRDLRAVVLPPPPPPPTVTAKQPPPPELMEMIPVPTGSPIKFIVPIEPLPVPRMVAQPSITFTPDQFRPESRTMKPAVDRIYHAVEVDRIPVPVFRKTPRVGGDLLRTITDPKVLLTFVVTARGTVENITVVQAASADYGRIVAEAVAEWRFEPAMKGGRRVRCFVLQSVSVIGSRGDSPFTAH